MFITVDDAADSHILYNPVFPVIARLINDYQKEYQQSVAPTEESRVYTEEVKASVN